MIKRPLIVLLAILLLAAGLRIRGLVRQPLWLDEVYTTVYASSLGMDTLVNIMVSDVHPPVYYAQLNLWMQALGTQDFIVRLNSVWWGLLAVAALYAVSVRFVGSRVALIAALLLAVSACAVFYAQQARMYALMMFLAIGVWHTLDRFLKKPLTWETKLSYFVTTGLFLYTQGVALLMLPAIIGYAVLWAWTAMRTKQVAWRERFGNWLMWTILIVVLYIPWLFLAAHMGVSHTVFPDLSVVAASMTDLIFGYGTPLPAWIGYLLLGLVLMIVLIPGKLRRVSIPFVLAPIGLNIFLSFALRPIWLTRSISFVLPFVMLALAYSLDVLG